jgi:hypothetical protein
MVDVNVSTTDASTAPGEYARYIEFLRGLRQIR